MLARNCGGLACPGLKSPLTVPWSKTSKAAASSLASARRHLTVMRQVGVGQTQTSLNLLGSAIHPSASIATVPDLPNSIADRLDRRAQTLASGRTLTIRPDECARRGFDSGLPETADVVIVGGGVTGSALFYQLADFTNLSRVVLLERRKDFAEVASGPNNNSQTIHCGDIETNYTPAKAALVQKQANMLRNFATKLPPAEQASCVARMQKMAIGVGAKECEFMVERFQKFKPVFKRLELLNKEQVAAVEPLVVYDSPSARRQRPEDVVANFVRNEVSAVDYYRLAHNFVRKAQEIAASKPFGSIAGKSSVYAMAGNSLGGTAVDTTSHSSSYQASSDFERTGDNDKAQSGAPEQVGGERCPRLVQAITSCEVWDLQRLAADRWRVWTNKGPIDTRFVVFSGCGHSLLAAHRLGYAKHFSCLPVAGSFYFAPRLLEGKVYTVQNPKLPFAALHGDPDLIAGLKTRFGPTALPLPLLERYRWKTFFDFAEVLRPSIGLFQVYWDLFKDHTIRNYLFKNFAFEIPYLNTRLFARDIRKIVPSINVEDLTYAHGFGGVRPQIVDTQQGKLLLGEGKISPENDPIIFNVTPSPGGTTCLGNGETDMRKIAAFLGCEIDEKRFREQLLEGEYPVEDN